MSALEHYLSDPDGHISRGEDRIVEVHYSQFGHRAVIFRMMGDTQPPEPPQSHCAYPWADHARPTPAQERDGYDRFDTFGVAVQDATSGREVDVWWVAYSREHARAIAAEMLAVAGLGRHGLAVALAPDGGSVRVHVPNGTTIVHSHDGDHALVGPARRLQIGRVERPATDTAGTLTLVTGGGLRVHPWDTQRFPFDEPSPPDLQYRIDTGHNLGHEISRLRVALAEALSFCDRVPATTPPPAWFAG